MSEIVVRRGYDSWAWSGNTSAEYGAGSAVQVLGSTRRGFVYLPLAGVRGRTVLSATLSMHTRNAWAAQTLSVRRIAQNWSAGTLNWGNQPTVTGATATVTTGALAVGAEILVDVTTLIQQVAAGAPWYGFRLTSDATGTSRMLQSFDSGMTAWTLTVELSDVPEEPTGLAPDGGSVSTPEPMMSWNFTNLGGNITEQSAFQVQIDPAEDGVSPNFDSGTVVSVEPEFDAAASAYVGPASGGSDAWRVRVQANGGVDWSDWSDWAPFTYTPKPTLTIDDPAGPVIYDPTPPVEAHITGGTLEAFQILVTRGNDRTRVLYNSGVREATHATDVALTIPERDPKGARIFTDDVSYQIGVRIWDTVNRASGVIGDPTYVEQWTTVTFDDDVAVTAPAAFTVAQVGISPRLVFTWTRASEPDAWVILRDGRVYVRLDSGDVPEVAGTYEWTDDGYAAPLEQHTWTVKAVVANRQSVPSNAVVLSHVVEGVWLLSAAGDVLLEGDGVDGFRMQDRRATYKPINVPHDVDIITGLEGVSGSYAGFLTNSKDQSVTDGLAVLAEIKDAPTETVQMVWATKSVPVNLRHLTYLPASTWDDDSEQHNVSFEFWQVDDFEYGLT